MYGPLFLPNRSATDRGNYLGLWMVNHKVSTQTLYKGHATCLCVALSGLKTEHGPKTASLCQINSPWLYLSQHLAVRERNSALDLNSALSHREQLHLLSALTSSFSQIFFLSCIEMATIFEKWQHHRGQRNILHSVAGVQLYVQGHTDICVKDMYANFRKRG